MITQKREDFLKSILGLLFKEEVYSVFDLPRYPWLRFWNNTLIEIRIKKWYER